MTLYVENRIACMVYPHTVWKKKKTKPFDLVFSNSVFT